MTARASTTWWANRKSRMGLRGVVAKAPPKLPDGREWWCMPPTSPPEPAYVEYVEMYRRELMTHRQTQQRDALLKSTADWMRAARRLLHERMGDGSGTGTETTEDIIISCKDALHLTLSIIHRLGGDAEVPDSVRKLTNLLSGRADEIRRRRGLDPAHPIRRVPDEG